MAQVARTSSPQPPLSLQVYLSETKLLKGGATFSPVTSTIILGQSEAVLVDAQFIDEDVAGLADMIEGSGRRLKTIFITHGHADHYFGSDKLVARFPGADVVASPSVVDYMESHWEEEIRTFSAMFPTGLTLPTALPARLQRSTIDLEGEELRVIEVGQGDIAPSTVLYVPSLSAVVAGDVVYNGIHQMLGLSGPTEWALWIDSIETIRALKPRVLIAGHKQPGARDDDAERILADTESYIREFAAEAKTATSAKEIIDAIGVKYPRYGNITTLIYSASAASKRMAKPPW